MSGEKRMKYDNRTKQQEEVEEESGGRRAGNKTIHLDWNDLNWAELNWREERNDKERGGGKESHWPVCMQYECWSGDFAALPMHAQIGCPAQTEGALFMERRPNPPINHVWGSTLVHTHTHALFFFLSLSVSSHTRRYTSPHKHEPLWRRRSGTRGTHDGIYKRTLYLTHTHKGIQIIYLQYTVPAL